MSAARRPRQKLSTKKTANEKILTETCVRCERPLDLCVCEAIVPINNRIEVVILRHPQEQDRVLGTARLAALQLKTCVIRTGLSWNNLTKVVGHVADPKRWGVLYLGTAKTAEPLPMRTVTVVTKKGEGAENQDQILRALEGIIVLDGNWSQAKALWWRNAWLLKCQRLVLQPQRASLYGALRKEPRRDSVSSIEAIAYTLAFIEKDGSLPEKIFPPFRLLLEKVRRSTEPEKSQ